jgi:hypothetical protein
MRWITGLGLFGAALVASGLLKASPSEEESFEPIIEAQLPEGFPGPTPVGTIEVKRYPEYRKATSSGRAAFWTLFRHIQQNRIAMTAPVEMTYSEGDAKRPREQSMAFLYGSPTLGTPGQTGSVEVADVPAATVVSIGVRGPRTDRSVLDAYDRLQGWLESRTSEYAVAGPVRVMAYNSPFVPRDRQFFEVQIPIESRSESP